MSKSKNPFKIGMRVRAKSLAKDWKTDRTMQPGECGTVTGYYAFTVIVKPNGKKLTIETDNLDVFEIIK